MSPVMQRILWIDRGVKVQQSMAKEVIRGILRATLKIADLQCKMWYKSYGQARIKSFALEHEEV